MSVYEKFTTTSAALVAFALGQCRRHVEIEGHVIDLVQAMAEQSRPVVEPEPMPATALILDAEDHAAWDRNVASNVRNALAGLYIGEPAEEVEYARPKPGPLCPCCLRPESP